jgi:CHAT domain-containing protein/Flp pilus assembly protein TadD
VRRLRLLLPLLLLLAAPASAPGPGIAASDPSVSLAEGRSALDTGDQARALLALSSARHGFHESGDLAREAECLSLLGRVHRGLGRHAAALEHFERAIELDRKLKNPVALAADLVELGREQRLLGDLRAADRQILNAFEILRDAGDPVGAASALVDLGIVRRERGDAVEAAAALRAAVDLFRAASASPSAAARATRGEADARTVLGSALADLGRYGEAVDELRRAEEAWAREGEGDGRGAALFNLGNVHAEMGDWERAAALYRQAQPLLREPGQRVALDSALASLLLASGDAEGAAAAWQRSLDSAAAAARPGLLLNLGQARLQAGDEAAAEQAFREAAAAARAASPPERGTEAAAALALGRLLLRRERVDDARKTLREASALAEGAGLSDLRWRAAHAAGAAEARAKSSAALPLLKKAVDELESSRRGLEGLDPWAARAFVRDRLEAYRDLVDALLAAGDGRSAFLYAERMRAAEMDASRGPAADPEEARLRALAAEESGLQAALEESGADSERSAALRLQLSEARARFALYVDELRNNYEDFDRLAKIDPEDLEELQAEIAPDEVVLQPLLLPDRIALLVFTSDELGFREVKVPEEDVAERIGRVLRTLRERRLSSPEKLNEHLEKLGAWLWEPVAAELEGRRRVVLVPAGALRYLPFAAIRRGGHALVETHEVAVLTNVGALKRRAGEELRLAGPGLLLLGNPDGTLPAADQEVDAVAALFPGSLAVHGARATRALLAESARGRSVVHLATHGVLDAQAPERSHIVLSEKPLSYLEIPTLHDALEDVGLVVLSACETAVPLAPEGDAVEGGGLEIAGLAHQFRRAGVPRLLASLWQVSDESTQKLMLRFYEGLGQGRAPAEALATAQRALLADPATAHPFHWAAFQLMGSAR